MRKITFLSLLAFFFCGWLGYGQIDPIEVTGFNEDVVANGVGPMAGSTTIPIDADNFCYLSEDWKLNPDDNDITVGLPADGVIVSPNTTGLTYQIPTADAPYEGNNSLRIGESGASGTLSFVTPENYTDLYLLVTSGSGAATVNITVNFVDGSSEEYTSLSVPDWYQTGLPVEISGIGRGDRSNNNVETPYNNPKLFQLHLELDISSQAKDIENLVVTKTNTGNAVFNLLAISGEVASDCLSPLNITVNNITGNSAEINWVTNGVETEWEIEYGPAGFDPGTGSVVNDVDGEPGYTLADLSIDTDYEVYVTAVCADEETSAQIGPVAFTTPACPEDIEVFNDEGLCGAVIEYTAPEATDGGTSENLLLNPSATEGLDYWNIEQNGGSGWQATEAGFATSYGTSSKSQEVILADAGFTDAQMDETPAITISEDYIGGGPDFADTYFLTVELRSASGEVIESFSTGNITTTSELQTITHTFSDYGTGVRSIYFLHGGQDTEYWGGQYGSVMTNAQVTIDLPAINVVQTEGLPSGSEFPVGVTNNTFEITEGDGEPSICSFSVTVLDVEAPEALVNDITIEMNEDLSVNLAPEDIDAGSTDNCEIASMSLNIVSLDCDNIGENEVVLTVTDVNGNSSVSTSTVTLVDTNDYCNLDVKNEQFSSLNFYPNPTQGEFTIESYSHEINKIEIYDVNGRLVKTFNNNNSDRSNWSGDISQLVTGVYFINIYSGTQSITKRIIKE